MAQENPYDLRGQHRREQAKRDEDAKKRAEYLLDLSSVMGTPEGQRVLRAFLGRTHVFASSFMKDAQATAFREGERNVGLSLMGDMSEANAEVFGSLLKATLRSKE